MDVPAAITALRIKVAAVNILAVALMFLGAALPIPKHWRSSALLLSVSSAIAAVAASGKLVRQVDFHKGRTIANQEAFQTELAIQTAALEAALQEEYFPQPALNVQTRPGAEPLAPKALNPAEPGANVQQLNPDEPGSYADPFAPAITPELRGKVVELKRAGKTQDEIILEIWGCKKGGTNGYKAAREKYRLIVDALESS